MANKKAYVFASSDGGLQVYPPVVVLERINNVNDTFTLVNLVPDDVVLGVEEGAFTNNNAGPEARAVRRGNSSPALNPVNAGAYSYSVVGAKSGKKAKGNSDPVIIIDI